MGVAAYCPIPTGFAVSILGWKSSGSGQRPTRHGNHLFADAGKIAPPRAGDHPTAASPPRHATLFQLCPLMRIRMGVSFVLATTGSTLISAISVPSMARIGLRQAQPGEKLHIAFDNLLRVAVFKPGRTALVCYTETTLDRQRAQSRPRSTRSGKSQRPHRPIETVVAKRVAYRLGREDRHRRTRH